jgi:hypothetical protein
LPLSLPVSFELLKNFSFYTQLEFRNAGVFRLHGSTKAIWLQQDEATADAAVKTFPKDGVVTTKLRNDTRKRPVEICFDCI